MRPTPWIPTSLRLTACLAVLAAATWVLAVPAAAGTSPGYDISWPQCNTSFPTSPAFGIVGVNGGRVYLANPCLGTGDGPSELAWAYRAANGTPAFYANTGDPGPNISTHWPTGQTSPQVCSSVDTDSTACSYDYGWNAAQDSYNDAVRAEQQLYPTSTPSPASYNWWLDVETANSWETLEYGSSLQYQQNDTAAIRGELAFLAQQGVKSVGIYSDTYQWGQITGGATLGSAYPNWVAGANSSGLAAQYCSPSHSFSGGSVTLTQYPFKGFDADHLC